MKEFDNVEMAKDGDTGDLVFTAVKTSKTRNLNGNVVDAETREEITRIPDNRDLGREIAEKLAEKYDRSIEDTQQNTLSG